MKITEFMLGDWVLYNGTPTKMTSALMYFDIGDYQPISITSKILEENGWKLVSNTRNKLEYSWSTGAIEEYADIHIYVGKDHSNIWRWDFPILNIHLYRGDIELTKFRYVHELQHAIKLCGIDKEITL